MKWSPRDAVAQHAAQILADPKSREEDCISARKAIANPYSQEALDALSEDDLDRLESAVKAKLAAEQDACAHCGRSEPDEFAS